MQMSSVSKSSICARESANARLRLACTAAVPIFPRSSSCSHDTDPQIFLFSANSLFILESHLRCDNKRPKCRQCEARNRDCVRSPNKSIFRHWSKDQVEPKARETYAIEDRSIREELSSLESPGPSQNIGTAGSRQQDLEHNGESLPTLYEGSDVLHIASDGPSYVSRPYIAFSPQQSSSENPIVHHDFHMPAYQKRPMTMSTSPGSISQDSDGRASFHQATPQSIDGVTTHEDVSFTTYVPESRDCPVQPFKDPQEACLLRYFIDELASWFDLCDKMSHFRLCVPMRARRCRPLLDAIFSVASRHIVRQPQYQTATGIVYRGFLLPNLTSYSAIEYMLRCIPALSAFHEIHDDWYQENLMAAAIILRQCEEMDEEEQDSDSRHSFEPFRSVDFLSILQTTIERAMSLPTRSSLTDAVIWMALRLEIYLCIVRKRAPRIRFNFDEGHENSALNNIILFAGDVASWCWGDRSPEEWARLASHQKHLQQNYLIRFVPLLEKGADRTKGEIFPTVWYESDAELTAVQFFDLARAIMIAEDPDLDSSRNPKNYRAAQRKAEAEVRNIVLRLCGFASARPTWRPSYLFAIAAIMHYGDFFTDPAELEALASVVQRAKAMYVGFWGSISFAQEELTV